VYWSFKRRPIYAGVRICSVAPLSLALVLKMKRHNLNSIRQTFKYTRSLLLTLFMTFTCLRTFLYCIITKTLQFFYCNNRICRFYLAFCIFCIFMNYSTPYCHFDRLWIYGIHVGMYVICKCVCNTYVCTYIMYVCNTYVCTYVRYVCMYVRMYVRTLCIYVCNTYVCTYVMYLCMYVIRMYVRTLCMYVCTYVMYVCM
jgi:hypothetical protein